MMEFKVEGQDGNSGIVDANYIVSQLQTAGYNPQGLSSDGTTLTLSDDQGPYEIKTADALKNLGWNVLHTTPTDADYGNIQMGWRAAVSKLPDDASRRAYIEGQVKNLGQEGAQVTGSGRDWFIFNPQTSKWMGVTNNPEWDMSDMVEAGLEAPRAIASALGGGVGAVSGAGTPASLALGAAGAGLAGGAADTLTRAGLAAFDPQYREVAGQNLGGMAADVGMGAGLDAATMGLGKGIPAALGAIKPGLGQAAAGLVNNGLASSAAKAVGRGMEVGGGAVKGLTGILDNRLGRDVATLGIPVVGDASAAGFLAQAPAMATRGAAKGLGSLGEAGWMRDMSPAIAEKLRNYSANLLRNSSPGRQGVAEEAQYVAERLANRMGTSPGAMPAESAFNEAPSNIMENLFRGTAEKVKPGAGVRAGQVGRSVGRGIENLETVGKGVEKAAGAIAGGAIKGTRAAATGVQRTGQALRGAGTIGAPIENRALGRFAAEEAYGPDFEEWNPLRRRERRYTMGSELAQK